MARRRGKQVRDDQGRVVAVHAKAANGEGSVYPDGDSWRASYYDAAGKRRTASGRTRALAIAKRAEKLERIQQTTIGYDPTVAAFSAWWLEHIASHGVRDTTLETYTQQTKQITARIGGTRMAALDRVKIVDLFADLATTYATSTVKNTASTMSSMCDEAVEQGLLPRNPCTKVPRPAGQPTEPLKALSAAQVHQLVAVLDPKLRWSAAVACCYLEGMRVSEALGIAVEDLDLEAGTVWIRRGLVQPKTAPRRLDNTKTERAKAIHHLSKTTVGLLRARIETMEADRAAAGDLWTPQIHDGAQIRLVNTTATGGLPRRQAVYTAIQRACLKAKIDPKRVGCHTGRRSVVSVMSEAGMDVQDIADHVGHAQVSTTRGYVVTRDERPAAVAAAAHSLLDPAAGHK